MRLPITPESYDKLIARFPAAVMKVWEIAQLTDPTYRASPSHDRPGLRRENVFDTTDGLRLIISRNAQTVEGRRIEVVEASISIFDTTQWVGKIKNENDILGAALRAFRLISGLVEEGTGMAKVELSPNGVVHFLYPWLDLREKLTSIGINI